jgi:hypothetical protein
MTEYLLNPDHPEGGSKARYFLGLGYILGDVDRFRSDLLLLGRISDMEEDRTPFGLEYGGVGTVIAPNGRAAKIRTAWILLAGSPPPRLITAYPQSQDRSS